MDDSLPEFCLALKAARERKGITLDEIANATKIPVSMFEALERSDLRFWPKGLFGRSFFRAYVGMIGVKTDEACAEFVRLFSGAQPTELPPLIDPTEQTAPPPATKARSLMDSLARFFASSTSTSTEAEPQKSEEPRAWTTDARRVGEPRMRVRIKFK